MNRHLTQQRLDDLVNTFRRSWQRGVNPCIAMRNVAKMPARRFYISAEAVIIHIKEPHRKSPEMMKLMLEEIFRRCNGNFSYENIESIINQPAPQFYIQPETARKLIQKELKRRRLNKQLNKQL